MNVCKPPQIMQYPKKRLIVSRFDLVSFLLVIETGTLCNYKDTIVADGAFLVVDNCTTVYCEGDNLRYESKNCRSTVCEDPVKIEGECCEFCPYCKYTLIWELKITLYKRESLVLIQMRYYFLKTI